MTVIKHPEGPEGVFPFGLLSLRFSIFSGIFWNLKIRSGKSCCVHRAWIVFPLYTMQQLSQANLASVSTQLYTRYIILTYGFHTPGKTVFLIYVLLRRLMDGLTTIYCDGKMHAHIFDGMGVRRLTLSDGYRIPELDADPRCCALVNLGDCLTLVPDVFYPQLRKGRVVMATSPDQNRWSNFAHEHMAKICCMPTWSWGPLYNIYLQVSETWWPLFVACS